MGSNLMITVDKTIKFTLTFFNVKNHAKSITFAWL